MKRKNDSIGSPSQILTLNRRPSLLDNSQRSMHNASVSAGGSSLIAIDDLDLPEEAKLAKSKYFLMTENQKGKILACGEEVHTFPRDSRFVLRIYNRDFNSGKVKDYVELKMEEFQMIHGHKSEIEKKIKEVRTRQSIFKSGDLEVTVGPGAYKSDMKTVVIAKGKMRSSMYLETFVRMLNYTTEVNSEFSLFCTRQNEDERILNEVINVLAFVRNEQRANGELGVWKPDIGGKCGILTTCDRIVSQARAIISKK